MTQTPQTDHGSTGGWAASEDAGHSRSGTDDADLRASLSALSRLSTGRLDLTELLVQVATYAVQAIPGADGAGLTMMERDRADTVVASAPFVREIDAIQYGMGEGPCISAARDGATMRSGSLGGDRRWPRFGPRAGRLGVHSVLSLPLLTPDGVFGAMNVYAHGKDAFDEQAARIGELFAVPAAIAVQNAQVLAATKRLAARLQAAVNSQAIIDQAVGILMSRSGYTPDQAHDRLRQLSQTQNIKLVAVAASLVDEAVRRARGRRTGDAVSGGAPSSPVPRTQFMLAGRCSSTSVHCT